MKELLNPYQQRAITVSLIRFEENLRNALSLLEGQDVNGILFTRHLEVSEKKKEKARNLINLALGQIHEMKAMFDFQSKEQDPARQIASEMSISWENLMDVRSKRLRGYGEVSPELAGVLDPRIKSLSAIALKLATLFEEQDD